MVTVASHKRLFTYYQRVGVDNHTYYREFIAHFETIETYGGVGAVRVIPSFLAQKMKELVDTNLVADVDSPTNTECMTAIKLLRDEFLGALMLSGANKDRFSALKTKLSNQYGFGNETYPKLVNQCLTMLNRWVDAPVCAPQPAATPPVPQETNKTEDEDVVFAQWVEKKSMPLPKDESSSKGSSSSSYSSFPSSTFHHGGGSNSYDYDASKWGASLRMMPHLGQ
jgi:hypothetical protein